MKSPRSIDYVPADEEAEWAERASVSTLSEFVPQAGWLIRLPGVAGFWRVTHVYCQVLLTSWEVVNSWSERYEEPPDGQSIQVAIAPVDLDEFLKEAKRHDGSNAV